MLLEQPPRNIDPRYTTTSIDFKLTYLAYARMVDVENETMEPRYDLAESVEPLPGLPERGQPLRYQITLREARFSDGSPVTSADIVYTIDKLADEKTGSAGLRRRFAESGLVRPIEVVSPRVLRIAFAHSHATAITDLDFGIVKSGSFEKPSLSGLPIGAGPFVPVSEAGEVTRFIRNAFYHRGPPPIERLTLRVVRDANSRLLSLVGGSADLTQNTVSPLLFDAVGKWGKRLQLASAPSAILFYLGMNNEDARLRDRRVRRAIAHAIDRERIVRTKLHGKAQPATSLLPPFHWAYSPPAGENQTALSYDPEAAEAPRRSGLSRSRWRWAGPPLHPALQDLDRCPAGGDCPRHRRSACRGRDRRRRPSAGVSHLSVGREEGQLPPVHAAERRDRRAQHVPQLPALGVRPSNKNLDAGINRMRYRDAAMDALLDAGQREMDRLQRRQIYEKVQEQLLRDLPMLPLGTPTTWWWFAARSAGYRMMPTAQFSGFAGVKKSALSALVSR